MKRICAVIALMLAAVAAGAQSVGDAVNFSSLNYAGTARSMALGNAMTAVGGDLGAIVINPAGSAVYGYSEFAITPGLTISSVNAAYSSYSDRSFGASGNTTNTRFDLPNIGLVMRFENGYGSAIKSWSLSFQYAQVENYYSSAYASGVNGLSSRAAELATGACGLSEEKLDSRDSFNNTDYSWDLLTAYQSGTIGSLSDKYYIGSNEALVEDKSGIYHYIPGDLNQASRLVKSGTKNDMVTNFALNINDRVYAGFSVGMPSARYRYTDYYTEAAVNPGDFPVEFIDSKGFPDPTWYESNTMDYYYESSFVGIYAKLGVIARLTDFLRVGAAVQSPASLSITENWQYAASATFVNSDYNGTSRSPLGEYSYGLTTPWLFNVGLAGVLGGYGFLSADYEMVDYSSMRFKTRYSDGSFGVNDYFYEVNNEIKSSCGASHNLRLGLEVKPLPMIALRGGYGFMTNAFRESTVGNTNFFSFGFGYSSPGSFYVDAAAKCTSYSSEEKALYYDYDGFTEEGEYVEFLAPHIRFRRNLWNVSLTLGFRF